MKTLTRVVALICLVLICDLPAQRATLRSFGVGCPGSSAGPCISTNPAEVLSSSAISIAIIQYAVQFQSPNTMAITGFEFPTRSLSRGTVTIQTVIYRATARGFPDIRSPAITGSMSVGTTADWYETKFAKPFIAKPNEILFLSWIETNTARIIRPRVSKGRLTRIFSRSANATSFSGPRNEPWSYKVNCLNGPKGTPALSSQTPPRLGQSMNIRVDEALASAPVIFSIGVSNTKWGPFNLPLDLKGAAAPGCFVLASLDVLVAVQADNTGLARFILPIPQILQLVGAKIYAQSLVLDPSANGLGFTFSNGQVLSLGR